MGETLKEINILTLNGEQYEIADKSIRENAIYKTPIGMATAEDTQEVHITPDGKLVTKTGGSSGSTKKQMYFDSISIGSKSTSSFSGTLKIIEPCYMLAILFARSTPTFPHDWELLHETEAIDPSNFNQKTYFLKKKIDTAGDVTFSYTTTESKRTMLNLIACYNCNDIIYHTGTEKIIFSETKNFNVAPSEYDYIIESYNVFAWTTTDTGEWSNTTVPASMTIQKAPVYNDNNAPRLVSFIKMNKLEETITVDPDSNEGENEVMHDLVELIPEDEVD